MEIKKIAAIDIGSNAVRLLINTIYIKEDKITFNKTSLVRVPIRLGRDVFVDNKISGYNINRLIDTMKSFRLLMNVHEVDDYIACATSAMREANNGKEVVAMVEEQADIDIEIIDGEKEGKIIFNTELKDYLQKTKNYLYVDVGGGSTELTILINGKAKVSKSFKLGAVRFLNKPIEGAFKEETKSWLKEHTKGLKLELIGSGGNINFIFKRSGLQEGKPMSLNYLIEQHALISSIPYEDRLDKFNMKPDRADVIVPALNIYTSVMKWSKSTKIYVPKTGLADGMIQYLFYKTNKKKNEFTSI